MFPPKKIKVTANRNEYLDANDDQIEGLLTAIIEEELKNAGVLDYSTEVLVSPDHSSVEVGPMVAQGRAGVVNINQLVERCIKHVQEELKKDPVGKVTLT